MWMPLAFYPDFLFTLFNILYTGFLRIVWFIMAIMSNFALFCPRLYFDGALNTWKDPEVFEQLPISPQDAQLRIQQAFPLTWFECIHGASEKLLHWLCLFETEKRLAKRLGPDQLFSELSTHLIESSSAKFRFHASRSLASTMRNNRAFQEFGTPFIRSLVRIPKKFICHVWMMI